MSQKESRQLELFGGKLLFETGAEVKIQSKFS